MNQRNFFMKFKYNPEICYEDFTLEMYVNEKNICEFTVDGKVETDTANLIFLSDWFKHNLEFILDTNDKFPLDVAGISGIEKREKAYEIGNEKNKEIEWFENIHEWSERHMWTFSGIEMIFPSVVFRRVDDKIEISWNNTDKYKNEKYKIEFINLKGMALIGIEEFETEILKFIEEIEKINEIVTRKLTSIFYGRYLKNDYLYERTEEDIIQKDFLKKINCLGYKFNTIYDLILLDETNKNLIPIFYEYLKLFRLEIRKHLVRFVGVKGFDEIVPLLKKEFYEIEDREYRVTITNTLWLTEDNDKLLQNYVFLSNKE